jgi:hypothetical protein
MFSVLVVLFLRKDVATLSLRSTTLTYFPISFVLGTNHADTGDRCIAHSNFFYFLQIKKRMLINYVTKRTPFVVITNCYCHSFIF